MRGPRERARHGAPAAEAGVRPAIHARTPRPTASASASAASRPCPAITAARAASAENAAPSPHPRPRRPTGSVDELLLGAAQLLLETRLRNRVGRAEAAREVRAAHPPPAPASHRALARPGAGPACRWRHRRGPVHDAPRARSDRSRCRRRAAREATPSCASSSAAVAPVSGSARGRPSHASSAPATASALASRSAAPAGSAGYRAASSTARSDRRLSSSDRWPASAASIALTRLACDEAARSAASALSVASRNPSCRPRASASAPRASSDALLRASQRPPGALAIHADVLAPEFVEPRSRLRGGCIGPARGRGTLHVLLERGRRLPARDRGDLGLADADRGGEGLAVEPEPARGVGRAVEDLVGDVAAEDDVGRPTGDLAGQVLADFDRATVVEKQADLDAQRPSPSHGRWRSSNALSTFVPAPRPRRTPQIPARMAACQLDLPASFGPETTVNPGARSSDSPVNGPKAWPVTRSMRTATPPPGRHGPRAPAARSG